MASLVSDIITNENDNTNTNNNSNTYTPTHTPNKKGSSNNQSHAINSTIRTEQININSPNVTITPAYIPYRNFILANAPTVEQEPEPKEVEPKKESSSSNKTSSKRQRRIWTQNELKALKDGVLKHGKGNWRDILNDPNFAVLSNRTNVNLKDKWRNVEKDDEGDAKRGGSMQYL